ncbi:BON domain-containing protein [Streptomyces sp. NPDC089799]|uniref:BON domain-containing protein n=1 Tax=Streptomyces sp. NPDC089799 TaxID=3155066 RepID=UPI0034141130
MTPHHSATTPEYQAQHLRERLAHDDIAELGVRVEVRGDTVLVWGPVSTLRCRETVLRIAGEVLPPLPWRHDLTVVSARPPDHGEDLP